MSVGSLAGGVSRYLLVAKILHLTGGHPYPFGTLAVNVAGSFVAGIVMGVTERFHVLSQGMRLFLLTGFLGGFTTFSSFALETIFLARTASIALACLNVISSVACGLLAVVVGFLLIRLL